MTPEEYLRTITSMSVQHIRARIDKEGAIRAEAHAQAAKLTDSAMVLLFRDAFDSRRTRRELDAVEFLLGQGAIVDAAQRLEALRNGREFVLERLRTRFGVVGWKVSKRSIGRKPGSKESRNVRMAREFLRRSSNCGMSASALKADIGKKEKLGRTQSIEAINEGLTKLSGMTVKSDG